MIRTHISPGEVVPSLSNFWVDGDSSEYIDYGTRCELLVPAVNAKHREDP